MKNSTAPISPAFENMSKNLSSKVNEEASVAELRAALNSAQHLLQELQARLQK